MESNLEKLLRLYDYNLPSDMIANKPASPRDNSRLLVYKRREAGSHTKNNGEVCFDKFLNLDKYLPKNAVLVFNETKVLPARLELKKETGGKVKILYVGQNLPAQAGKNMYEFLADRKLNIGAKLYLPESSLRGVSRQQSNLAIFKVIV